MGQKVANYHQNVKKLQFWSSSVWKDFHRHPFRGFWMFALSLTLFDDSYGLLRNHFLSSSSWSSWSSSSSSVNHILWPIIHRFISPYTVCKIYNLCKNTLFVNFHILSLSSYAFVESQNERKEKEALCWCCEDIIDRKLWQKFH